MLSMEHIPDPGLYEKTDFVDYCAWRAANHSSLKRIEQSPAHAHHAWSQSGARTTTALELGDATHAAILEPDRWTAQYAKGPEGRRGTKKWKEALEAAEGRTLLRPEEYAAAERMRDHVHRHPTAGPMLQHANDIGAIEVSWVWDDPETGVRCKARTDAMSRCPSGYPAVVDVKTTQDASERAFGRSCATYWYHTQARFYLDGLTALSPKERKFLFIAVEKTPPYGIRIHELLPAEMEVARIAVDRWLRVWRDCEETNEWPGYPTTIGHPELPKYAMRWEDEDE
jgi:hypothetical protein